MARTDYDAQLAQLPPELRAAYRDGRFDASLKDQPFQVIPTQWVIEASGGNPLYVREFVRGAIDSGAFQPLGGLWTMVHRPRAGASLIELMDARMADLDKDITSFRYRELITRTYKWGFTY